MSEMLIPFSPKTAANRVIIFATFLWKMLNDALEQYDKKLSEYLMGMDELDFMDDELPFN